MNNYDYIILGAGLSGISTSYHLGHDKCLILEQKKRIFGHVNSYNQNSFTWDIGPHVSFTKSEYVKNLFARNVKNEYLEWDAKISNYYAGNWINHPVQMNLSQVPEPLRTECLTSFKNSICNNITPSNYDEWLNKTFGETLNKKFITKYTKKYWTIEPKLMSLDWVSNKLYQPTLEEITQGYLGAGSNKGHYINSIRYPVRGGFKSFVKPLSKKANIRGGVQVLNIDTKKKLIESKDGEIFHYKYLINTIPLNNFIPLIKNISGDLIDAGNRLNCSKLLLINIEVPYPLNNENTWFYVYDEEKYSTRVSIINNLSDFNTPENKSGLQVEVYFSDYKPCVEDHNVISSKVLQELIDMGILHSQSSENKYKTHVKWVEHANIIFDHKRKEALSFILDNLIEYGLMRKSQDTLSTTDWSKKLDFQKGNFFLSGRFAEWKYYWTDDCVLSAKSISEFLNNS